MTDTYDKTHVVKLTIENEQASTREKCHDGKNGRSRAVELDSDLVLDQ